MLKKQKRLALILAALFALAIVLTGCAADAAEDSAPDRRAYRTVGLFGARD